jgi:hypothetical protein
MEFVDFLKSISTEMSKTNSETNPTTEGFLEALSAWLEDTTENEPKDFDWQFASQLIRAGIFYE